MASDERPSAAALAEQIHWAFNLPSKIYDLPFLSEQAKRSILGENARELFKLDPLPRGSEENGSRPDGQGEP